MRALLDTNLLISYLLTPDNKGTIQSIIESAFEKKYILLLSEKLIRELITKLETKKYLLKHISFSEATLFISSLYTIAVWIPEIEETIPTIGRDIEDDYLIVSAIIGEAEYLVSGDKDLLVLKEVEGVKIVSPAEFLEIL